MKKYLLNEKWRVILSGLIITSAPIIALVLFVYFQFSHYITIQAIAEKRHSALIAADNLKGILENALRFGNLLVTRSSLKDAIRENERIKLLRQLKDFTENSIIIERAFLTNARGIMLADYPTDPALLNKDVSNRPWYKGISKNWEPYVSDFYLRLGRPQRYLFSISIPIKAENNSVMGALVLQIAENYVKDAITTIPLKDKQTIYVVDKKGNLIYHPHHKIDKVIDFSIYPAVQKIKNGWTGVETFADANGKSMLTAYHTVKGIGWGIVVEQSSTEVFAPLRSITIGLFIFSAVMLIIGSYFAYVRSGLIYALKKTMRNLEIKVEEQRQTEEALIRGEETLNRAQSVAHIGSWLLNIPENRLEWSDETYRLFSIPRRDAVNLETFASVIHPDDRERVFSSWDAAMAGATYDIEHRILVDDRTFWVRELAEIQWDSEGKPLYGIGTVQDITERKMAEQALEQAETEWRVIMDASEDIMYLLDTDRHLLRANKAFFKNIKSASQAAIGNHIADILHPDTSRDVCPVCHAQDQQIDTVIIMEKDHPCNPVGRPLESTIRVIRDKQGHTKSILTTIHDLSNDRKIQEEKAKLEMQLYQAQKMEAIGQLAGGVAHDFNNILTAIIGYGSLALTKMAEDDPQRINIEHMLESAGRATHLTKDLLLFSRKQISARTSVDLNEVIRKMEKFLIRIIGEDISCKTILHPGAMPVLADAHQLEQVIMNLATNARDSMPKGGLFIVTTDQISFDKEFITAHGYGQSGIYALITVSDTGKGMDKAVQQRVFEPFFTTKEIGKGTGLGLAVVYGIVKGHDGHIDIYSEQGVGTTFKIYLPLTNVATEETAESRKPIPAGTGETILICEDESQVREILRLNLESYGYKVIEAENGEDAVKKFRNNIETVSLVILDVIMPIKNGKEVWNELKGLKTDAKVLFMSGYTDDIITSKGLIEEGVEFIPKPIRPDTLLRKIREVVDK